MECINKKTESRDADWLKGLDHFSYDEVWRFRSCAVTVTNICTCIKGKISSGVRSAAAAKNLLRVIYCENVGSVILSNGAKKHNSGNATFRMCCTSSTLCFGSNLLLEESRGDFVFFTSIYCPVSIISYRHSLFLFS